MVKGGKQQAGQTPDTTAAAGEAAERPGGAAMEPAQEAAADAGRADAGAAAPAGDDEAATTEPPAAATAAAGAETPPPAPEPEHRGSGIVPLLWTALVLAVLIGAAYATVPFWMPTISAYLPAFDRDPFQDPRVAGLAGRVQALEEKAQAGSLKDLEAERARFSEQVHGLMARLDELETALDDVKAKVEVASGAAADTASLNQLTQEVGKLEKDRAALGVLQDRIARLEAAEVAGDAKATENLSAAVADISERLGELERTSEPAADAASAQAVVLAVGQLREAVARPGSFTAELEALKAVAGDNAAMTQAIAVLAPFAATGVPTLASLRLRFEAVAGDVARAAIGPGDGGWMDRTVRRLKSLVTVRRIGGGAADTVDAVVARAEANLEAANLMDAVNELEKLGGAPAKAAAPWLADARARLAAEKALTTLHVHAVSLLNPAQG